MKLIGENMLKTNENKLVEFLLQCQPGPPKTRDSWSVDHPGEALYTAFHRRY